jgi:lipoyl(octanoyl) transferase
MASVNLSILGRAPYPSTYNAMRAFTAQRVLEGAAATPDELWLCEHDPVFTQGIAGKPEHVLLPGDIPVVEANRGGQVTYHGPGQVVAYPLIHLKRAGYFVKEYVFRIEEAVIRTLMDFGLTGHRVRGAPGIYVRADDPASHARLPDGFGEADLGGKASPMAKIAALGIKVERGCTYHGVALNVAMDLTPFLRINPCGYSGLLTTDMAQCGVTISWDDAAQRLAAHLQSRLA